jgi:hypothetical protein
LIDRIFLAALTRPALPAEGSRVLELLRRPSADREAVYQDLLWSIFSSKEFMYNH